ncbi:MAG: M20 family metallopeptidase [Candidatus Rokubacteria bacterium]|nr:M20 family metallopeptidase [Candidatus Rokubacteria bacterium]
MNAVELTRELIRFDTINPPGEEEACARHLGRRLEAAGFRVEEHAFAPRRTSLVARIGNAGDRPPLCFTGHIDVVPLGGAPWSHEPFAGELAGGRVYGRGSTDMKSGVAAFVVAAAQLAPRLGATPGLVLVITAGEETACEGARHLTGVARALPKAGAIVVAEPTSNAPCVGHKGALWLEARTSGVTAHGSMPERGVNAVYKAARAVLMLEKYEFGVAPHPVLGSPTLNVGNIRGGLNVNSVPDAAVVGIDIRTIPEVKHGPLQQHLAGHLGSDVALAAVADAEGVWSDPGAPWMQEVFEVAERIAGAPREVRAAPYFTDASALTPAMGGAPTVILGPGEAGLAHQTDEYCLVERVEQSVEIYAELTRRWCGV